MLLTARGIVFSNFRSASPAITISSFTDSEGATLLIDTATLVQMYELVKRDLDRRRGWDAVMDGDCQDIPDAATA